jgi:hypothetical protein
MPNESHKHKDVTLRSSPGPEKNGAGTDTVPDLALPARLGVSTDTLPEQAGVYVPPRPVASVSDHRTIEISPVRLAREIDPRRAPTELRLSAPPPRKQSRPILLVLTALLLIAVGGFFAARFAVAPSAPLPATPVSEASPPLVPTVAPPPEPTAEPVATTPPRVQAAPEPQLVPVTPADLGIRPKGTPAAAPAPRESAEPKRKAREPWLE